jgi:hypothetical protein
MVLHCFHDILIMWFGLQLDLNQPLEEQGPFTVILHKLTDIIALTNQGDPKVLSRL